MFIKNLKNVGSLNDIKISTVSSGIKDKSCQDDDLLLIELDQGASIAGVFTKSLTSSAPVNHCKHNLKSAKSPSVMDPSTIVAELTDPSGGLIVPTALPK